jgi:hypothetical protein
MTNEDKIDNMLKTLQRRQDNPNFKLHKFEVYSVPEQKEKVVHSKYTTQRLGESETIDEWVLVSNGKAEPLQQLIPDKTARIEFISSLENAKYALGGVIFN